MWTRVDKTLRTSLPLPEAGHDVGREQFRLLDHRDLPRAVRVRNRRASQLIDVLESQVDQWLQALDTFVRWATDREPVDKSLIDKLKVRSLFLSCLLYTSPSPRDRTRSRMPSSA